jgi:hypothetical protein
MTWKSIAAYLTSENIEYLWDTTYYDNSSTCLLKITANYPNDQIISRVFNGFFSIQNEKTSSELTSISKSSESDSLIEITNWDWFGTLSIPILIQMKKKQKSF